MATAQMRISVEELRLLRALSVGQAVKLPSAHRLRLELLGLLHDGPAGPRLTTLGRHHVETALPDDEAKEKVTDAPATPVKRDRLGRRLPHGRSLPF
ncbi:MAG: hypothetical protein IKE60_26025 [Reyranella sp.]|jgi:hypothetical protein|uniref:hypothetical protein n=1 Tax=Reyranella sp. TaxID=1929291 RepID=UPI000962AA42|nr:hypothetical protein [Reyranella sp.]MBN9539614.1 hypothetical protein [Alphaproteobacteria bacterium]MBR2818147.1 hypothetical protein [Reyranella sp.]OJU45079.1 MAG: hypothetical protein BGN99_30755 [Alphaproteobacteria bacterium 65-37]